MSANVRCAGGGNAQWNLGKGRGVAEPCGWKGERFTQPPDGRYRTDWAKAAAAARAAKPCPWCKGRVELIPQESAS